jgi:hypothetical protein
LGLAHASRQKSDQLARDENERDLDEKIEGELRIAHQWEVAAWGGVEKKRSAVGDEPEAPPLPIGACASRKLAYQFHVSSSDGRPHDNL